MTSAPDVIARLRALVAEHGSIAAVAKLLDVNYSNVAGVLRGDHGPGEGLYLVLGITRPVVLPAVDPGNKGLVRLHRYVLECGSFAAASEGLGICREHLCLVLHGRRGMGPKLSRALNLDEADTERRMGIARELKRQALQRGRFSIPKARLAEIQ